jgi:hypothetical protein
MYQLAAGYQEVEARDDIPTKLEDKKATGEDCHNPIMVHVWRPFALPASIKFQCILKLVKTEYNNEDKKEDRHGKRDQIKYSLCLW